MNRHQKRLAKLEAERAFYAVDPESLPDEQLDAWIEADRAKDPAGWQVLEAMTDADLDLLAAGDAATTQAYRERAQAIRRSGSL